MFDREKVIEELIQDDTDSMWEENDYGVTLLETYFREGFRGYSDFTDEELIQECKSRDISYLFGEDD